MSIDVNVQNDLVIVTETTEDIVVNVSNAAGPQGPAGAAGVGVPVGGTTGQVLKKFTNTNYDTYWAADGQGVPYSGASGSVNLGPYDLTVNELTIGKGLNGVANNTALGKRTLFHNTTGNYNTAVGHEAGHNLTTGQYNTAIGQSAMFTATTAGQNTAVGVNALLLTTSGGSNVAVGLDTLQHITTGSSNTAIGYNAGSHITGGSTPNTTATNSVFIGRDSKAAADGQTNQIVIGQNAVGNGSNTATFGNTATTANYFTGSVNGGSFVKSGGTSSQFLKADGSVDSSVYYLASNPSGYTTNVGTVTSVAATAGTGITISGSPITTSGTLTITNSAPDQVVALTASTGISVSGTYPNFTITNTSPSSGGTVTSVGLSSATSGVTIGSTPITTSGTITLAIATASGSQNGLLSSTDWTTFNGKQNAITLTTTGTSGAATLVGSTLNIPQYADQFVGTVTSVAALTLGTTGTDLSSTVANGTTTPVITLNVPTASATNRGALSSADWTTFNGKFNLPSLTAGSVLFSNGTTIAQDNANFFWDDTNNRLGIGITSPGSPLDVNGSIYSRSGGLYSDTLTAYSGTSISLNAGTSHFAITVNGSERARITAAGRLLLGTTTEGTYLLDVNGTGSFSDNVLINKTGASTLNLGQGTTTLDYGRINFYGKVTGNSQTIGYMSFINTQSGSAVNSGELEFAHEGTTADNKSYFSLKVHNGTSLINPLLIASTGAASFSSSVTATQFIVGSATTSTDVSVRYKTDTGDFSTINDRGTHAFGVYDHQAASYRTYITTAGNLLVGTTTDSGEKLQVSGNVLANTITLQETATYSTAVVMKNRNANQQWGLAVDAAVVDDKFLAFIDQTNAVVALKLATLTGAATFSSSVTASSFIKSGGTSSQYLMADGSVTTGGGGSVDELQVALICQVFG